MKIFLIYWLICACYEAYLVNDELNDWTFGEKIVPIVVFMVFSPITAPLGILRKLKL